MVINLAVAFSSVIGCNRRIVSLAVRFANGERDGAATTVQHTGEIRFRSVPRILVLREPGNARTGEVDITAKIDGFRHEARPIVGSNIGNTGEVASRLHGDGIAGEVIGTGKGVGTRGSC